MARVAVEGGRVVAYVYGEANAETILCINGGPGISSRRLREAFHILALQGFRVLIHDQLGTGASDRPDDPSLWTLQRYVGEVEAVREALGQGKVHLLGHSWGGWLGIEYALAHGDKLKSCIFSNTSADTPTHLAEVRRLLAAFGDRDPGHDRPAGGRQPVLEPLLSGDLAPCSMAAIPRAWPISPASGPSMSPSTCRSRRRFGGRPNSRPPASSRPGTGCRISTASALPALVLVGAYDYTTPAQRRPAPDGAFPMRGWSSFPTAPIRPFSMSPRPISAR